MASLLSYDTYDSTRPVSLEGGEGQPEGSLHLSRVAGTVLAACSLVQDNLAVETC